MLRLLFKRRIKRNVSFRSFFFRKYKLDLPRSIVIAWFVTDHTNENRSVIFRFSLENVLVPAEVSGPAHI